MFSKCRKESQLRRRTYPKGGQKWRSALIYEAEFHVVWKSNEGKLIYITNFRMHYAEMLHLTYLSTNQKLKNTEKLVEFLNWNNDNLLFCQYTLIYACLLFSRKIKQINTNKTEELFKKCKNQAWDLTYLSFWSTLYWHDNESDEVFLFSTMDKDLEKSLLQRIK